MKWLVVKIDAIKASTPYSLVGGPFGSNLTTRDYVEEGVPVIRGVNLPDKKIFSEDDYVFVSEKKADELSPNNAFPGDLVFTQRGTLGQVGLIPESSRYPRYVISQSQMKLRVNLEKANAKFVYYFFRHPTTVQKVKNQTITSGVPHINLGILKDFEILLPPISVQEKIVSILSAYDDLIENNLRQMVLLEESARLLYCEWFVRLRFPGYEHTRIVNGVPEGWERAPLEQSLVLQRGYDLPSQNRQEGTVPVYASTSPNGYHNKAMVQGPGVVTGRSGTLGVVNYVTEDFWPLNTTLWVREFKRVTPIYAFFLLQELKLEQYNGGVSVPTLDRKVVHRVPILIPGERFFNLLNKYVEPIFTQITNLKLQNQKLKAARDLLLPRLMSGEIAV